MLLFSQYTPSPFHLLSTVPTELPDSLDDAAIIAAEACAKYSSEFGQDFTTKCRVDFDTTIGDETYTILKSSTEFMQKFVSALCYATIDGLQQRKQDELMRVAQARVELKQVMDNEDGVDEEKKQELLAILQSDGRNGSPEYKGLKARIYFPDEGNAALAKRDWEGEVPDCVEYAACGGMRLIDKSDDALVFFFCPQASEAKNVERLVMEYDNNDKTQTVVLINPTLVDMGVTGFGMAGRMLRERLLDQLEYTYYLRTLTWGALTRTWPNAYSVWQEDEGADGGYKLISTMDRLPSNPEVEDIYDLENDVSGAGETDILGSLGDFVSGMMRL